MDHSTTTEFRDGHSGIEIDNKIYLVAGGVPESRRTTEYWDGERWGEGPELPHEVSSGSCTVTTSPTTILVTGGEGMAKKVVELNINTGRWRHLPDMREKRWGHGCTIVGRKVVVAGGVGLLGKKGITSEILDLDTEQWSRAGDMTTEREKPQLVTVNGRVIILGGFDNFSNRLDTVEELDMGERTWRRLGVRMKIPRSQFAATVMGRRYLCN